MKPSIRIASGQGFWGDQLDAPKQQVENGPIDYLMLDYLAEVTMSIMQKQRARDPAYGYARDFVPLMGDILPAVVERGIRVVANAGGITLHQGEARKSRVERPGSSDAEREMGCESPGCSRSSRTFSSLLSPRPIQHHGECREGLHYDCGCRGFESRPLERAVAQSG